MYAIVDIAGQQLKVEINKKIFVHRLHEEMGARIELEKVLLIDNDKDIIIGEPIVEGAKVIAKVLSHPKGDKIKVFKKKRRKGYAVSRGHRQSFTEILIENILEKGAPGAKPVKKASPKKEEVTKEKPKTAKVKAEAKAKEPAPKEKSTKEVAPEKPIAAGQIPKKDTAKKEPVKKTAVKKEAVKTESTKKPAEKKATGKSNPEKKAAGTTKSSKEDNRKKTPEKK